MRFQLDPRAKAPERPAPPPPGPRPASPPADPGAPPAEPLAPLRPAAAPPPPPLGPSPPAGSSAAAAGAGSWLRRHRVLAMALLGLVLLSGGAAATLYAMELPPFEYPRRYLLEGSEIPARMQLGEVPDAVEQEFGVRENPGRVDEDDLDAFTFQNRLPEPDDAWGQSLRPTSTSGDVLVFALRFSDEKKANQWSSLASISCSTGGGKGAILKDGDVVVVVMADGDQGAPWATRVVNKLKEEAPDLRTVCGA